MTEIFPTLMCVFNRKETKAQSVPSKLFPTPYYNEVLLGAKVRATEILLKFCKIKIHPYSRFCKIDWKGISILYTSSFFIFQASFEDKSVNVPIPARTSIFCTEKVLFDGLQSLCCWWHVYMHNLRSCR